MIFPLDTFTVKYYSALNAEPIEKFILGIKNYKLTQVNADLYVSPKGDDSNFADALLLPVSHSNTRNQKEYPVDRN